MVSEMTVPSSSSSTGTRWNRFIWVNSGVFSSPFMRSMFLEEHLDALLGEEDAHPARIGSAPCLQDFHAPGSPTRP